jgi:N-carbamoylputrescine amidase
MLKLRTIALGALLAVVCTAAEPKQSFLMAAISVTPKEWDKEANYITLERFARQAAARGAKLIATPEGFLEGYVGNENKNPEVTRERYLAIGEPVDGPVMTRIRALARELNVHLSVGFAERRGDAMFNSTAVIDPEGEIALLYSKSHTAHDEPFNTKGIEFPVAATALGRIGSLICYDRRLPETARVLAVKGAQLLLVPAWGSYNEMNDALMRTRAFENGVWVAFVHPKRALIIDPRGNVVARNDGEGDQLVYGEIVLDERVGSGPIRDRKPEIYGEILR